MKRINIIVLSSVLAVLVLVGIVFLTSSTTVTASTTPEEAAALADNGDLTIIDMRSKIACDKTGKPKGSYHIAMEKKENPMDYLKRVAKQIGEERMEKPIGFICNTSQTSSVFVDIYLKMGLKNITSISNGMYLKDGWLDKKMPLETCSEEE